MKFETFEQIVDKAVTEQEARTLWLDKMPSEIAEAFFDNSYVQSLEEEKLYYLEELLGTCLFEELMWYLYDCNLEDAPKITKGNISWTIKSREDFYSYIRDEYDFD